MAHTYISNENSRYISKKSDMRKKLRIKKEEDFMKKMKWLGGLAGVLAAAVLASFAVTGCDLELSDKDDRAATASGSDTGSVPTSYTKTGSAKNITLPALSVTNGFTVEFTLNDALSNYSNDWATQLLSYSGCHVTIPNLDPYNNTISGSALTGKNAFPNAPGAPLETGYAYDFPWGSECKIKIEFTTSAIKWYKDGNLALTYGSGLWDNNGVSEFVGYYIKGLKAGQVVFNSGNMNITDLSIECN